jgi:hypothetical protein
MSELKELIRNHIYNKLHKEVTDYREGNTTLTHDEFNERLCNLCMECLIEMHKPKITVEEFTESHINIKIQYFPNNL